jgi:p21-activated kinase 1
MADIPLQHSASSSSGEKSAPRVAENQLISPKRYSDEGKEPRQGMIRKKSGFSGFMNSIGVGSPRGVKISAPENPVHVTHVGYDNQTGQFTVWNPPPPSGNPQLAHRYIGTPKGVAADDQ